MPQTFDAVIIAGGIMGLMTALELKRHRTSCAIIDAAKIGNAEAASFSMTRAGHSLYDDAELRVLADRALDAYRTLTPDGFAPVQAALLANTDKSFAQQVSNINPGRFIKLERPELASRFSGLSANSACVDEKGGVLLCKAIGDTIIGAIHDQQIPAFEKTTIERTTKTANGFTLHLSNGTSIETRKVIITAGMGSVHVLRQFIPDAPDFLHAEYPDALHYVFKDKLLNIPAFAAIEEGFFHLPPVGNAAGKIGVFTNHATSQRTHDLAALADQFFPEFSQHVQFVETPYDKCAYDKTADGNFIVGPCKHDSNIILGCGFNGTGYKFAPIIADMLSASVLKRDAAIPASWNASRIL